MLLCRIEAKPVAHLMQYYLLQWEVAKVKQLMTSNMTLTTTTTTTKLGFYVPFNSQGHIGTGPQNCHLWDSNPQR